MKFVKPVIAIIVVGLAVKVFAGGPSSLPAVPQPEMIVPIPSASTKWKTAKWTGSDTAYKKIEVEIDLALHNGDGQKTVQRVRMDALKNLSDARKVFAWAYAVHKSALISNNAFTDEAAYRALAGADPNNVYEYERLRFLLTQETYPNDPHPDLEGLGSRLLTHNPDDYLVRMNLIYDLCSPKTIDQAKTYAEAWVAKQPLNDTAHLTLAFVYQDMMIFNASREYADRSIKQYESYLSLASPTAPSRKNVQHLIAVTEKIKPSLK